jgi:Uri superfamily endonuclease
MIPPLVNSLPGNYGTYALHLRLSEGQLIQIGRLGVFSFPAVDYAYLGSAFGPGGIRARLGRHLYGSGKLHWHIDYLRSAAQIQGFWYSTTSHNLECQLSRDLALLPEAFIPVPGFGASDCRTGCKSHLIAFPTGNRRRTFENKFQGWISGKIEALE